MTEAQKREEIMNYFNETIFEPAIRYSQENNIKEIAQGARYTRMRMQQLDAVGMIHYFWAAVQGTDKSIAFSELLRDNQVLRFEDILEDVRVRFNNDYLRG